ncbi:hypothetical protein ANANG_G00146840 [Anguilla anguilla]|uniref:Uncharacterized protein n=1 Tax=Anguilla anguilla TaxID=7936 RepID=A0A9D3MDU8_ANGAN|nr:hypothetical protein ANANG_G00146840 [Anguilla anguilla]
MAVPRGPRARETISDPSFIPHVFGQRQAFATWAKRGSPLRNKVSPYSKYPTIQPQIPWKYAHLAEL